MMTRKDYVAVSDILAAYKEEMSEEMHAAMAEEFADYMENDNDRFLRGKFLDACNVSKVVQAFPPRSASSHVSLLA